MKPRHSDMLELFNKVAEENKIFDEPFIALAEDTSKKSSSEIDAIELLYGKKKDIKSNEELLQDAHLEPVIVNTSYDLMNSVVEDLHQRQSIMVDIANKNPRVLQTNFRYVKASEDLMQETTKLAFLLENKKQYNLMSAADGATGELEKIGAAPLIAAVPWLTGKVIAWLAVGAVTTLTLAKAKHNSSESQGYDNDLEIAIKEMSNVFSKFPNETSSFKTVINLFGRAHAAAKKLEAFESQLKNQQAEFDAITKSEKSTVVETAKSLVSSSVSSEQNKKRTELINASKELTETVVKVLPSVISVVEPLGKRGPTDMFTGYLMDVKDFFWRPEEKKVKSVLPELQDSAQAYLLSLNAVDQVLEAQQKGIAESHKDSVEETISRMTSDESSTKTPATTSAPKDPAKAEEKK